MVCGPNPGTSRALSVNSEMLRSAPEQYGRPMPSDSMFLELLDVLDDLILASLFTDGETVSRRTRRMEHYAQ